MLSIFSGGQRLLGNPSLDESFEKSQLLRPIVDISFHLKFLFQSTFLFTNSLTESTSLVVCLSIPHDPIYFRHTGSHWLFSGSACFWVHFHIVYPHANTLKDIPFHFLCLLSSSHSPTSRRNDNSSMRSTQMLSERAITSSTFSNCWVYLYISVSL